jgi:hypothetical protein
MRSLPISSISPPSFEGLGSGKPLNVEALPFIPPHSLKTPPAVPSEGATTATTTTPPTQDPRSIVEPPSPHPGGRDLISSTVKPVAPVTITTGIGSPSKQGFTRAERRAVETVINVLLEMKSKGDARASPGSLPPLILAKDRTVYKNAGNRANRFWRLICLGIKMGWLESGPGNAWIDVGKGWTEDPGS